MINDDRKRMLKEHLQQVRNHLMGIFDLLESELDELDVIRNRRKVRGDAVSAAAELIDPDDHEALNDRHCWILTQLGRGVKLTRTQVMEEFNYSVRHAKRLLGALTTRGLIRYESAPRPGYYVLCGRISHNRLPQGAQWMSSEPLATRL